MKRTGFRVGALGALVSLLANTWPAVAQTFHPGGPPDKQGTPPMAPPAPPMPMVIAPPAPPAPIMPPAPPSAPIAPAKLRGSFVYVYSFLDVREDLYTSKVLDRFDGDLTARLQAETIGSKILHFDHSAASSNEFYAGGSINGSETRSIPVMETIYRNLPDEMTVKARFRLIVFPSDYTVAGAWRFYQIRFVLIDTRTNRRVMDYLYSGKHLVMWKNSENSEARSKKILDHLFAELKTRDLL
jgi:hypothetical protein